MLLAVTTKSPSTCPVLKEVELGVPKATEPRPRPLILTEDHEPDLVAKENRFTAAPFATSYGSRSRFRMLLPAPSVRALDTLTTSIPVLVNVRLKVLTPVPVKMLFNPLIVPPLLSEKVAEAPVEAPPAVMFKLPSINAVPPLMLRLELASVPAFWKVDI